MIRSIDTPQDIAEGVEFLTMCEPRFARVIEVKGHPELRRAPGGLAGLLNIVTEQQISIHAAQAIWKRVEDRFGPFHCADMLACEDAELQACGLSRPKIRTIRAVLEATHAGELDFDQLHHMPDEDVHATMTAIKGIGPWTAEIYLLTSLGRTDTWPKGDLALQEGARLLFSMRKRPDVKRMEKIARKWRPWRSVAARLLWSYYRHVKFEGGEL